MTYRVSLSAVAALALFLAGPLDQSRLRADEPPAEKVRARGPSMADYIRLENDRKGEPLELQTSITRFVPADGKGVEVDLVGVVHVGDESYYRRLNREFRRYDVVLYELVAPPESRVPDPDAASDNPLRMVQTVVQSTLDLTHQLDVVDYKAENFVHADLSPTEMQEAMAKRGETGLTLALGVARDLLREQNARSREAAENPATAAESFDLADLQSILFDEYGSTKLKRMMAQQFADLGGREGMGLGRTLERILVDDRNEAAVKVLGREMAKGRKRIAIFYGAAHMPDFETRLVRDFGLVRGERRWISAWDLTLRKKAPAEAVINGLLQEFIRQSLSQ